MHPLAHGICNDKENWNCTARPLKYQNVLWTHGGHGGKLRCWGGVTGGRCKDRSAEDAQAWNSWMARNVYRHLRAGCMVQGVAVHSETAELLVIYTSKDDPGKIMGKAAGNVFIAGGQEKNTRGQGRNGGLKK